MLCVLSGMSNLEQLRDNLSYMKEFKPLDERESAAVKRVCEIFKSKHMIPCTACHYCTDGCPKKILFPTFSHVSIPREYTRIGTPIITITRHTPNITERPPTVSAVENAKSHVPSTLK